MNTEITTDNIHEFRGTLTIEPGDLPYDTWAVFDRFQYEALPPERRILAPLDRIVSTKNQLKDPKFVDGSKPDPRQTAFERMKDAAKGKCPSRAPIRARRLTDGRVQVEDGNATAQVLMLAGWTVAPLELLDSTPL